MSNREGRKHQRQRDPPPGASKKMTANANRDDTDKLASPNIAEDTSEPTLSFLAQEIRAIRVSTQNIEQDTTVIKAAMGEIEEKIDILSSRVGEAESRVASLESAADLSKQQVDDIQKEVKRLQDHVDDLDNRGRRCNIKILGIAERAEGNDMIQFLQREIPTMLEHQFETPLEIQRAHRVPTGPPRPSQGDRPRPIMVNMLRYQVKEEILRLARGKGQVTWHGAKIMFFLIILNESTTGE